MDTKKSPWAEPTEKNTNLQETPRAGSVGSMELVGIGMGEVCLGDKRFHYDLFQWIFVGAQKFLEELETGFARFMSM